jgi:hypothetical protein
VYTQTQRRARAHAYIHIFFLSISTDIDTFYTHNFLLINIFIRNTRKVILIETWWRVIIILSRMMKNSIVLKFSTKVLNWRWNEGDNEGETSESMVFSNIFNDFVFSDSQRSQSIRYSNSTRIFQTRLHKCKTKKIRKCHNITMYKTRKAKKRLNKNTR